MPLSKENSRNLLITYISVFFDSLGFALITPMVPYIIEEFHASDMEAGLLYSSYSFFSLLLNGVLSDLYGRKLFLILSIMGDCVGNFMQYISTNMIQLILARAFTGLFAGSFILGQAVIADLTTNEERNKYYSRMEALSAAAMILGPAVSGLLSKISIFFPLLAASIFSGIALILSFFFLTESNKEVIPIMEMKKKMKTVSMEEKKEIQNKIKEQRAAIKKNHHQETPKLTKVMLVCFVFEFCIRWAANTFDSRYGIYVYDKFRLDSGIYSIILCSQSSIVCLVQAFFYPVIVKKASIPALAMFGSALQTIAYFFIANCRSIVGTAIAGLCMWLGFTFGVPTTATIISTTNAPEVQGAVLSWNNLCSQICQIICPIVLSYIYPIKREAIFYVTMGFTILNICIMIYVSTWPNSKYLGKRGFKQNENGEIEMKEIEMKEIAVKDEDVSKEEEQCEKKEEVSDIQVNEEVKQQSE